MRQGRVTGVLTVDLYVDDINNVAEAVERLSKVFSDADVSSHENFVCIESEEVATYYYAPAVYYTANGDGSPEEYEDELSYYDEEDVRYEVNNALHGIEFEIDTISYSRKYDDDDDRFF